MLPSAVGSWLRVIGLKEESVLFLLLDEATSFPLRILVIETVCTSSLQEMVCR